MEFLLGVFILVFVVAVVAAIFKSFSGGGYSSDRDREDDAFIHSNIASANIRRSVVRDSERQISGIKGLSHDLRMLRLEPKISRQIEEKLQEIKRSADRKHEELEKLSEDRSLKGFEDPMKTISDDIYQLNMDAVRMFTRLTQDLERKH